MTGVVKVAGPFAASLALGAAALIMATGHASAAQEAEGRYSMSPAEGGGFVRLDRQTGAMTFCTKPDATKPEGWSCTPMGDAQQLSNGELERLQAENKNLKADKQHLEEMLGMADPSKPGASPPDTGSAAPPMKVPSEQDVDKAFDYFEGMLKKFRERMKKLQDTPEKEQQL